MYVAVATALSVCPLAVANAFNVVVEETVIAVVYRVDAEVGVVPSVV